MTVIVFTCDSSRLSERNVFFNPPNNTLDTCKILKKVINIEHIVVLGCIYSLHQIISYK